MRIPQHVRQAPIQNLKKGHSGGSNHGGEGAGGGDNGSHGGNHRLGGAAGVVAWFVEEREAIKSIFEPFKECHCLGDVLAKIFDMDNAAFAGIVFWCCLQIMSTWVVILIVKGRIKFTK